MKSFIVIALFATVAFAVPVPDEKDAYVVKSDSDNIGVGAYSFGYETSNGINAQEQGQLVNEGKENAAVVTRGQFSYTGTDGVVYTVTYTADENGYHPQGAHLPVAPQ